MARAETAEYSGSESRSGLRPRDYRLLGAAMIVSAMMIFSRDRAVGIVGSKRFVDDVGISTYIGIGNMEKTRRAYPHYIPNHLDRPHFLSVSPTFDLEPIQAGVTINIVNSELVAVATLGDHPNMVEEFRPVAE